MTKLTCSPNDLSDPEQAADMARSLGMSLEQLLAMDSQNEVLDTSRRNAELVTARHPERHSPRLGWFRRK